MNKTRYDWLGEGDCVGYDCDCIEELFNMHTPVDGRFGESPNCDTSSSENEE